MIKNFEDILAWQKAEILATKIYQQLKDCKDFGFRDQIQRAAVSVMNNIAEGFERNSNKEFKHFLFISKSSCGEVRSMLYLAKKFKYITKQEFDEDYQLTLEIPKLLGGLIKTLK